jgi:F-type H+-transporting ATPase subunit b
LGDPLGALGINIPFLISQLVNFGILLIVLRLFLWKPLMQRLEDRKELLAKQKEDAEAIAATRSEIEQEREHVLSEARSESEQLLAEARKEARAVADQVREETRQEKERLLAQAKEEAEEERNRLLGQMREQIASLAIAAANKLVGEALDERRQRMLVDTFFSGVREGRVEVLPTDVEQVSGPVVVTSALPLTEEETSSVRTDLASRVGEGVEIVFKVDPQILGGLIVRVGDRLIDGSVAGRLEQLHESLA